MIFRQHLDGINRSRLGRREGIGAATVEQHFQRGLQRQFGELPQLCEQMEFRHSFGTAEKQERYSAGSNLCHE